MVGWLSLLLELHYHSCSQVYIRPGGSSYSLGLTFEQSQPVEDKNHRMRILKGTALVVGLVLIAMAGAENNIQALRAVSESANQFSSTFFQTVVEENSGNLIMSPLSAAVVLAMAAYGARGQTEREFKKVLHLPSSESLGKTGYQALIDNLNNVQENKLLLANKVFAAERFILKQNYKDITTNFFRSATQLVNFDNSQEAANIINTWVEQNTNNLIKDIVMPADVDAATALVLVNAVYFKGQWKNKFNADFTKDMPFHVNRATVKNVPTMYRQGTYKYGNLPDLKAKFIVIPYKGDELSMVIILPNEIDGLAEVEQKLQNTSLTDILSQGFEREVELYLPKFKVETKVELNSILRKMGLIDAFTSNADFSGIADAPLQVKKVIQKAFIEVNEEGSEAAAATGAIMMKLSLELPVDFIVARPFYYHIVKTAVDEESATVSIIRLFSGYVTEPKT